MKTTHRHSLRAWGIVKTLFFLTILLSSIFVISSALADYDGVAYKINNLRATYPEGRYWNHYVGSLSDRTLDYYDDFYSGTVTSSPCATHNGIASVGQYDCNCYDKAMQCFGFANKLYYDVFGIRCSSSSTIVHYDVSQIQVGDHLRYGGHSMFVIGRSGNIITVAECNYGLDYNSHCKIKWDRQINITTIGSVEFIKHASNWDTVNRSHSNNTTLSFTYEDYSKYYKLGSTYAEFGVKIYGDVGSATAVGCELFNASKTKLGSCQDGAYLEGNCLIHHYAFQSGSPDINITLTKNTKYYYRYYVVAGGKTYTSSYYEFTTRDGGFTFEDYSKFYEMGCDYAHFGTKIYGDDVGAATAVGCELYDANKNTIASCQDGAYLEGNCLIHHYLFQQGSSDINIALTPGTTYHFRYYVVVNGQKNYSNYIAFKTNGTSFNITYDANGGNGAPQRQLVTGTGSTATANLSSTRPTYDGMTFLGWSKQSAATTASYQPGASYTDNTDVTLYAIWRANAHIVAFMGNGGTMEVDYQEKIYGENLVLTSTIPVRSGYTFLGWGTSPDTSTIAYHPGDIYTQEEGITLYAIWEKNQTATVTYDPNGGSFSITSQTRQLDQDYHIVSTEPTFRDHTFLGWATSDTCGIVRFMPGDLLTVDGDVTLCAVWSTTLSFVDYDRYYEIGSDYAHYGVKIYGEDIYNATTVGCELYDISYSLLGSCEDSAYREGNCLIHHFLFQSGSSDINISLNLNEEDYFFRYYVIVSGGKFYSDYYRIGNNGTSDTEINWTNSICYPFKRGGYFTVNITASQTGTFNSYQLLVWDSTGNLIIDKQDSASDRGLTMNLWYDLYTETGIALNPNSQYTYQYIVRFDGLDYSSPVYNFTTESASGTHFGVDVSQHQGQIDWATASQYIDFAIIRCGYGSDYTQNDDTYFSYNVSECERLGIPYGVYLYSYAENDSEAVSEAEHVLRLLAGHHPELPVYYDLEHEGTVGGQSNAQILIQVNLFCETISNAGYKAGVYANPTWYNGHLAGNNFPGNTKWLAAWDNGNYAAQANSYALWQYTSNGTVPGITGRVDLNYCANFSFGSITPVVEPVPEPDFIIPASTTTIEDDAFYGCAFTYVQLPETVTKIGAGAFSNCPNLKYIYIPEATTTISAYAFENVTGLIIYGVDGSYAEFFASKHSADMTFVAVE